MLRFVSRVLAYVSLAIAVVLAVIDATRSIAMDRIVVTPLSESWAMLAPAALEDLRGVVPVGPASSALDWLWAAPAAGVFFGLFFVLYMLGHGHSRRSRRFASA